MNTSNKRGVGFLGAFLCHARAERLAMDWVYLPDQASPVAPAAVNRLERKYPEIFSGFPGFPEKNIADRDVTIMDIRDLLRKTWESSDRRSREWYLYKLSDHYHQSRVIKPELRRDWLQNGETSLGLFTHERWLKDQQPPPLTPFEHALFHLRVIIERARRCANSECPAPYFLTKKKGQRYCSSKCSAPAQREQKRRWWTENRAKKA